MKVELSCPKRDEIEALAGGQTANIATARLQSHIEKCPKCRHLWQAIAGRPWTTVVQKCPPRAEIEALHYGNTSALSASDLHQHLESCPHCRRIWHSLHGASSVTTVPAAGMSMPNMRLSDDAPPQAPDRFTFLAPGLLPDEIGRLGNYRVLRLLGQGGMGFVFLAEDLELGRRVALKVLKPDNEDPDSWQRFLREARALAAIKHENLVTVYQAVQERDVVYFAMEFLEGETLDSWIYRNPSCALSEILRIACEITTGLEYLHERNLIHRDIKPANLWLEAPRGRVKILDLGLVRPILDEASLTRSGIVMGTPEFMAPEQARSMNVDARADLFSLGGVLYFLCTGRKPFLGGTSIEVLMALASETPPDVRTLNPQIPQALSDLIMQMIAREPRLRPASAAEVRKRLQSIQRKLPATGATAVDYASTRVSDTDVVPPSPSTKSRAQGWRGLGIAAFAGAAVMFATVALVWTFRDTLFGDKVFQPAGPIVQEQAEPVFLRDLRDVARENYPFKKGKKKGPKGGKDDKEGVDKEFESTVWHQGKVFPRGIFMHPPAPPSIGEPASLTYKIGKQFKSFQAEVSLRDGPEESESPCVFYVYGDGKQLWKSKPVSSQKDAQKVEVSVAGVDEVRIAVTCDGFPHGAHAVWLDPRVLK